MSLIKTIFVAFGFLLDIIDIVLTFFGIDDVCILDILGLFTIGIWSILQGKGEAMQKALKILGITGFELLPYADAILPGWGILALTTKES